MNNLPFLKPRGRRHNRGAAGFLVVGLAAAAAHAAAEPPRIAALGIRNAASFAIAQGGGGIAPGSIFVILGAGLGPELPVQGTIPYPTVLPDGPAGTRVEFRALDSEATVPAYLLYTSVSQLMGILPSAMPAGPAEVTVSFQGETSRPQTVEIVPRAAGLFTMGMNGQGPGVIQNVVSATDQPLNQLTQPALPGQYIVLWATGLGAIDAPDNLSPPVGNVGDDVEVEVAGVLLTASYAGRAPGFPGVDQINVRLPDEPSPALDDCYVSLRVWTGERPSQQTVFSAAAAPGPCKHPYGFSPDTLASLDAGGRVALGQFRLSRTRMELSPPGTEPSESSFAWASGGFFSVDALDLALFSPPLNLDLPDDELGCRAVPSETVAVFRWFNSEEPAVPLPVPESRIVQLDAGGSLQLSGPANKQLELFREVREGPPLVFDYDSQNPAPGGPPRQNPPGEFLEQGGWTLAGTGGADVGPFEAAVTLPPFPDIALPQTVHREQDLELTWPTAGYGESDQIAIGIGSPREVEIDGQVSTVTSVQVRCRAIASEGQLTVPARLMREVLSPAADRQGSLAISVARPTKDTAVFSAPGIDHGSLRFNFSWFYGVNIE